MKTEQKQMIQKSLATFMNQHNISASEIARRTNVNPAYVSQILNGKYSVSTGAEKDTEIADRYFLQLAEFVGYKEERSAWTVVNTPQAQRILATLQDAKDLALTNVIIGETGSGKTYVADIFRKNNPVDCYLVTVGSQDTIKDLIEKIMETLKLQSPVKSKSAKIQEIVRFLKKQRMSGLKPMLILDECEYLRQPALCSIKELFDNLKGTASLIMIGTDQLINNIEKLKRRNKDGIPQLYRRIRFGIRVLTPIDRTFRMFINQYNISDKQIIRFLQSFCDNYGELHDVLMPAMREADRSGVQLSEELIRTVLNIPNE